jgi:IclR family transcriptional regulator, KDG regulon repressor
MSRKSDSSTVPAIEKAFDILEYLALRDVTATVKELAVELGIPQATAFRTVNALLRRGYLHKNGVGGSVGLGPRNALLHKAFLTSSDLRRAAEHYMQELLEKTGSTVELSSYEDHEITFVDVLDSTKTIGIKFRRKVGVSLIGSTNPITLVVLANLRDGERSLVLDRMITVRETILPLNPDLEQFAFSRTLDSGVLAHVRASKVAIDYGTQTPDVTRIASPILSHDGSILGTLGIAGPVFYLKPGSTDQHIHTVVDAAERLSESLGHH